ncbi:hypothetical protein FB451DRAFT_1477707 [Mycena latifolia]|nr:hypothetical protein FB451DRAFT_1477707 [Mycena latifolia]
MPASTPPTRGSNSPTAARPSTDSGADWVGTSLVTAKIIAAAGDALPFPYVKGLFGIAVTVLETVEKVKKNQENLKELCEDIVSIMKIVEDQISAHGETAALKFKSWCEELHNTTQTVENSLVNIAVAKKIGNSSQEILQWLTGHKDWLLFLDNADDPKINLNKFLPRCNHGNILITSRNPQLCVYAGWHYLVSDMEEEDAIELLLKSAALETTSTNKQLAAGIVTELYYLPLAIIQAGAFISKSGSLASYLDLFRNNRTRLLSEAPAQSHDDYAWTVYTTWKISFDQLSQPAATLLRLCSCLHHQGISEQLFSKASTYQAKSYGPSQEELKKPREFLARFLGPDGIWDSLLFMDITNELQAYSIVNFDLHTKMFSIHPLVHNWVQSSITDPRPYQDCMKAIVGMTTTDVDPEGAEKAKLASPHIDSLLLDEMPVAPDFNIEYGLLCFELRRFRQAEKLLITALEKRQTLLGDDHLDTLIAMSHLANTYHALGRAKEAEKLQAIVVNKGRGMIGEDHRYSWIGMTRLGSMYYTLGRFREAEELLVTVLQKVENIPSERQLETDVAEWLVLTYIGLGQFKEAEKLQVAVLETRKKLLGEDHPRSLIAITSLSYIYCILGRLHEAENLEIANLEKGKKMVGEHHLDTLRTMQNLAIIYYKLDRFKEAEELQINVFEKRTKILGENHPDTLGAMDILGSIYTELGRFREAEELKLSVLEQRKEVLGDNHPSTLATIGSLGLTYRGWGKLKEAEELQVITLEKRKTVLPEDHPDILLVMANLAWTYHKLDRFEEAENLGVSAIEKQRRILGDTHPDTLRTMKRLKETYQQLGKVDEAEALGALIESGVSQGNSSSLQPVLS